MEIAVNTSHTRRMVVDLSISPEKYELMYAGTIKHVRAIARDGRSIRFPAAILRPFVTREGISGVFAIEFDQNSRFLGISRL